MDDFGSILKISEYEPHSLGQALPQSTLFINHKLFKNDKKKKDLGYENNATVILKIYFLIFVGFKSAKSNYGYRILNTFFHNLLN